MWLKVWIWDVLSIVIWIYIYFAIFFIVLIYINYYYYLYFILYDTVTPFLFINIETSKYALPRVTEIEIRNAIRSYIPKFCQRWWTALGSRKWFPEDWTHTRTLPGNLDPPGCYVCSLLHCSYNSIIRL